MEERRTVTEVTKWVVVSTTNFVFLLCVITEVEEEKEEVKVL